MKKILLLLLTVIAAGIAVFFLLRSDSDEVKVKKVLDRLCVMGTRREGENPAAAALMINKTDEIFSSEVRISGAGGLFDGVKTPSGIMADLARYRAVFRRVTVRAQDAEVSFPEKDRAAVVFSGTLSGDTKTGTTVSEARDVECTLLRIDGLWKISELTVREVLER